MTKIQDIQARIKAENTRHRIEAAKLKAELEAARAERKAHAKAKAEAKKEKKAKPDRAAQARARAKMAKDYMKKMHPDKGGPGGKAFHDAYADWKAAEREAAQFH